MLRAVSVTVCEEKVTLTTSFGDREPFQGRLRLKVVQRSS